MRYLTICTLTALAFMASAQTPYLVKDLNTTYSSDTKSSTPVEFTAFGNRIYFVATTDASGTELWSTDGTSAGTSIVSDIVAGTASSSPNTLRVVNGALLLNARDANHGIELWATDGTAAGTHLLKDINPGPSSGQPVFQTLFKNKIYFSADDGSNGRELWVTDGTVSGTRMFKDIEPGSASSFPSSFVVMGNTLYFRASSALWKTDGTDAGTVKVSTVSPLDIVVAGSRLFFTGFTQASGWELWTSDGTDAGTQMVTEIRPGPASAFDSNYALGEFIVLDSSHVVFAANDGTHGRELWISDGTAQGTRLLHEFISGPEGGIPSYFVGAALNGKAFFAANEKDHGTEPWLTDGTDAGTMVLSDIAAGTASSNPQAFVVSGGKLYFTAGYDTSLGPRIYVSDGTPAGTGVLGDSNGPGVGYSSYGFSAVGGMLYFTGANRLTGGEPWVTDGTNAGTHLIANLAPDRAASSDPRLLAGAGNLLFFHATEGSLASSNIAEASLWRSDGTAAGTFKLKETGQHPSTLMGAGSLVFFNEPDLIHPSPAYNRMSDGTVAGTKSTDDFNQRFGGATVGPLYPVGDVLFADAGGSLWKTTGTLNAPAIKLGSKNPFGIIEFAGRYVFYAEGANGPYSWGVWTTDGTPEGTFAIIPDLGDLGSQPPSDLVATRDSFYFLKAVRDENAKLWKSDGTPDGTVFVKEFPFNSASYNVKVKAAGQKIYILFPDYANGDSLWVSDGTAAGTVEVTKIKSTPGSDKHLTAVGERVLYTRTDQSGGLELWSSDGTADGTKFLMPLTATPQLTPIDGIVYFAGLDTAHGTEPWTSDGTAAGTKMLFDLNPGPASSYPGYFTKAGGTLYFSAYTDSTGAELWALPLTEQLLSIGGTQVAEGDSGTATAHFTVSLTAPARQAVSVDYATSDGTAMVGEDYEMAAGTLTFAAGETTKTIDVRVLGDTKLESNESFFVTLRNASGARIVNGEAAAIVDDDDGAVDLSITTKIATDGNPTLYDALHVTNNGPRVATSITVTSTSTPSYSRDTCAPCSIAQLAAGASADIGGDYFPPFNQTYFSATVTARQHDSQLSNNSVGWTVNSDRTMAMNAAYLTPGATATITVNGSAPALITSSDPSVVAVPPSAPISNYSASFPAVALKAGTSTISVSGRSPLLVTVVAAGTTPRWPGGMSLGTDFTGTRFDKPLTLTITPTGTAPFSGAGATGTVTVTSANKTIASTTTSGSATTKLALYMPALGQNDYQINYGGDANFLPQTVNRTVYVYKGTAGLTAELVLAHGIYTLTVHASGSPAAAPSGTLVILNGATEVARLQLASPSNGTSAAQTTLTNLPPSPTLTINYLGDAFYDAGTQQVRTLDSRRRVVHH